MSRIVIMQPTYLPWIGYFDLMDQADCFVFLDNVQFSRQSWQQRNRIKSSQGATWLTVPVTHQGKQRIDQVQVSPEENWTAKHWCTIEQNYRRAAFWTTFADELKAVFVQPRTLLVEVNIALITWFKQALGLSTVLRRASEMPVTGSRIDLLISICKHLDAKAYLSPLGSAAYLRGDTLFQAHHIRLEFQHYEHPTYRQLYPPFVSHLSVLDLLMNEGPAALDIIRSGRRPAFTLVDLPTEIAPHTNETKDDASSL